MTIRFLCDEHVEPRTADELIARGIDATHVTDRPGLGASDEAVAAHAREIDAVVLTNDEDFLDPSLFPEVTVFYYPENHLEAHRLAERVESALRFLTDTNELPDRLFLTAAYEDSG
jgi:arginase family enzyme